MEKNKIPPTSRRRYPLYLRALLSLKQRGEVRVMSYQLGKMVDVAANTVRRDLMFVKHVGKSAYGYDIQSLIDSFNEELGTAHNENIVLIGCGNIGQGLLKYNLIPTHVGQIVCAFDIDPNKIGDVINKVPICDARKIKELFPNNCKIVILAIPGEHIDQTIDQLVSLNVKAVINFSDGTPRKRTGIKVHQIDMAKIILEIIYDFKREEYGNDN